MRLVPLLLVAGILTFAVPTASAQGDCYAVTHNGDPVVEACDTAGEDRCTGVWAGRGFTGFCEELAQCQYWYVHGWYVERTCWI